jgi:hypothetical protein
VESCKPLLRVLLETFFSLDYLLESEYEKRSLAFLVWHFHKELKFAKKLSGGTSEGQQLASKISADQSFSGLESPVYPWMEQRIAELNQILSLPKYADTKVEYARLREAGIKNPSWYQFYGGPKNIEQLAHYLKRDAMYEVLYRGWSGPIHGTDIIQGKLAADPDHALNIVHLRNLKSVTEVAQWSMNLSLMIFTLFIKKRIPKHTSDFGRWYLTIRDDFQGLNS